MLYRFRLPSTLKSQALGIACDFRLVPRPLILASLCKTGKPFPIPDSTDSADEWATIIRERGPILSAILSLGLENKTLLSFMEQSSQVLERLSQNHSNDGGEENASTGKRQEQSKTTTTQQSSVRGNKEKRRGEGTDIYLDLSSTTRTAAEFGDLVSATFDIPRDSDDSGFRIGKVVAIRLDA